MFAKIKNLSYLKREVIFALDLVLSVSSTFVSSLFMLSLFNIAGKVNIMVTMVSVSALISAVLILLLALQKSIIRYFSIGDSLKIFSYAAIKSCLVVLVMYILGYDSFVLHCGIVDLVLTAFLMIAVRVIMVAGYNYIVNSTDEEALNCFLYSTRGANPAFALKQNRDITSRYRIKGFLTTNKTKVGSNISGQKVYSVEQSDEQLKSLFVRNNIQSVIFTSYESLNLEKERLVNFCMQNHIVMHLVDQMTQVDEKTGTVQRQIKPIQIEDLLDREEIIIDTHKISDEIEGKVVMVTGAAGSIGSEISRQVASFGAKTLILFDAAETPLHNLSLELNSKFPDIHKVYVLGDVRSKHRVKAIMQTHNPSIVFHAAAYKHVPAIESNPCEGVLTNVWGSVNVAQRAIECGVKKFVMVSTDKAVNPTNVMGATKRIAEMCVQKMNRDVETEFITTRFGNVLGSNGSVIPIFKEQIAKGGPITVTDPNIIRYFMTIPEACRLVLQAATIGSGGEIMIFDMGKPEKIVDLARKMIQLSGLEPDVDIKIEFSGLRPGEKLYEELLSDEENKKSSHEKIQIANSRVTEGIDLDSLIVELARNARNVDIMETVRIMKKIVPEFKSKNSQFEILDSEN